MTDIHSISDDFDGTPHARWGLPRDNFVVSGGALHHTFHYTVFSLDGVYAWPTLRGLQWEIELPDGFGHLDLSIVNTQMELAIEFHAGGVECDAAWDSAGDGTGWGINNQGLTPGAFRYLRIYRRRPFWDYPNDTMRVEVSADGTAWTALNSTGVLTEVPHTWTDFAISLEFNGAVDILDVRGITVPQVEGLPAPPTNVPDPFKPNATVPAVPAKAEPECATLLDLIRAFSGQVRRAVRIVGPTTIEMVNPNEPLPTGWTTADAAGALHTQTQQLTAGATVLSLLAGNLVLDIDARLVSDDVRLPVSDWRIPQRLPLYGLAPAPVKRVTYTFSPHGFSGSVEYHVRDVPLSVRRTS